MTEVGIDLALFLFAQPIVAWLVYDEFLAYGQAPSVALALLVVLASVGAAVLVGQLLLVLFLQAAVIGLYAGVRSRVRAVG
ncbi:hypothetical protein [Natrialbaceae archaeon AArc-T1-2]|uniref:hypothetical protein n=1 Tax=Natrialbaceae archaeon AArc-T1-2 TaxID=3053904 RepID=UPI00255A751C|nr:hypothetical protein [Natrialbaceae archaeon AArc-T1-2]WIV67937.1 hypothetical protein QQ977_04180 [Natrialbaceae archaeon AArc-T1-2]